MLQFVCFHILVSDFNMPSNTRALWKQEVLFSSAKTFLYIYTNYLQISIQMIHVFLHIPTLSFTLVKAEGLLISCQ